MMGDGGVGTRAVFNTDYPGYRLRTIHLSWPLRDMELISVFPVVSGEEIRVMGGMPYQNGV